MKLPIKSKIAVCVAAVIGASTFSVLAYKSSVHNQICLSYEAQIGNVESSQTRTMGEMVKLMEGIKVNPLLAFSFAPKVMSLIGEGNGFKVEMNNTMYAYTKTCGWDRRLKFLSSPGMVAKTEAFTTAYNLIQNF